MTGEEQPDTADNDHAGHRAVPSLTFSLKTHETSVVRVPNVAIPVLRGPSSEPPKRGVTVCQGSGTVAVPHGCQHGSNIRHRSIQLIRRRTVNVPFPHRRMDSRFRHLDHLRQTGLNKVSLSLPFGIVLWRFGLQPPDDALQEALRVAIIHWILLSRSGFATIAEWLMLDELFRFMNPESYRIASGVSILPKVNSMGQGPRSTASRSAPLSERTGGARLSGSSQVDLLLPLRYPRRVQPVRYGLDDRLPGRRRTGEGIRCGSRRQARSCRPTHNSCRPRPGHEVQAGSLSDGRPGRHQKPQPTLCFR
jgi:hypothetical protein